MNTIIIVVLDVAVVLLIAALLTALHNLRKVRRALVWWQTPKSLTLHGVPIDFEEILSAGVAKTLHDAGRRFVPGRINIQGGCLIIREWVFHDDKDHPLTFDATTTSSNGTLVFEKKKKPSS
jgi:hypothetical protein